MTLTLENLKDAIRKAKSLEELKRLVGPSAEEMEAAKARLERMDAICPACNWDSSCPTVAEQDARTRWYKVMNEQQAYENQYC